MEDHSFHARERPDSIAIAPCRQWRDGVDERLPGRPPPPQISRCLQFVKFVPNEISTDHEKALVANDANPSECLRARREPAGLGRRWICC